MEAAAKKCPSRHRHTETQTQTDRPAHSPTSSCHAAIWHTSSPLAMNSRSLVLCEKIQPTLAHPSLAASASARASSGVPRSSESRSADPSCGGS